MKIFIVLVTFLLLVQSPGLFADDWDLEEPQEMPQNSIASGAGIPYGGIGGNLEMKIVSGLRLSAGFGSMLYAGVGWNLGLRYYPIRSSSHFSPRISVYYGTNSVLEKFNLSSGESEHETHTGATIGVGTEVFFGRAKQHGMDFEILYIVDYDSTIDRMLDEISTGDQDSRFKVSVGYRFAL